MAKAGTRGSNREAKDTATSGEPAEAADRAARRAEAAQAKGARLNSAQTKLRDAVIIARHAQRVPWKDIAREVGVSARQCQRVVEAAQAVPSPVVGGHESVGGARGAEGGGRHARAAGAVASGRGQAAVEP
jgi:hypothetical protein